MWPRTAETVLALWLSMSGFVFQVPSEDALFWGVTSASAVLVAAFALLSCGPGSHRWHLLILPVSAVLTVLGISTGATGTGAWHAVVCTALLLSVVAMQPSPSAFASATWAHHSPPSMR